MLFNITKIPRLFKAAISAAEPLVCLFPLLTLYEMKGRLQFTCSIYTFEIVLAKTGRLYNDFIHIVEK